MPGTVGSETLDGSAFQIEGTAVAAVRDKAAHAVGTLDPCLMALPLLEDRTRHRRSEMLALAAAIALHLALLGLLVPSRGEAPGDDGVALDAIAVSLVDQTPVISAPQTPPSPALETPAEETSEASPVEQEALETKIQKEPEHEEPLPPEQPIIPAPPRQMAEVDKQDEKPDRLAEPRTAAPPATAAALPSQTSAEAAPGAVRAYASAISKLLDRGKPKSHRIRGEVVVSFVINPTGRAELPTVARSSGNQQLDEIVVGAVQRIEFPPPPPEMSLRQRTFIVPFKFR